MKFDGTRIAGWFAAPVPLVPEGEQEYFWAWVCDDQLDTKGHVITNREPEIVRVTGADEDCDRRIYRTASGPGLDLSGFRGRPTNVIMWKGPLDP